MNGYDKNTKFQFSFSNVMPAWPKNPLGHWVANPIHYTNV